MTEEEQDLKYKELVKEKVKGCSRSYSVVVHEGTLLGEAYDRPNRESVFTALSEAAAATSKECFKQSTMYTSNVKYRPEDLVRVQGIARVIAVGHKPESKPTELDKKLAESREMLDEYKVTLPTFNKDDGDKLRYDLIPPEVLEELAKIYTYGAKEHGDNNWKKAEPKDEQRLIAATMRHFEAYRKGEVLDESGHMHISHALTDLSFLVWLERQKFFGDPSDYKGVDFKLRSESED